MRHLSKFTKISLSLLLIVSLGYCARVPQEVVTLNHNIGEDIDTLHLAYTELINMHFKLLRERAEDFLRNRWLPNFMGKYLKKVKGLINNPSFEDVKESMALAVEKTDIERKKLMAAIDADQKNILSRVDQAFSLLKRANSTVSDHLDSMKKVGEAREEVLNMFKLQGLSSKINESLGIASQNVSNAVNQLDGGIVTETPLQSKSKKLPVIIKEDNK